MSVKRWATEHSILTSWRMLGMETPHASWGKAGGRDPPTMVYALGRTAQSQFDPGAGGPWLMQVVQDHRHKRSPAVAEGANKAPAAHQVRTHT